MAILQIPITKGGKGAFFEVDTSVLTSEEFPEVSYERIMFEGVKAILNARMSKIAAPTKLTGKEFEDNQALALSKAQENYDDLLSGKAVKRSGAKEATAPKEVMVEARRLAKDVVKTEIRKSGQKPSLVAMSDITAAANELIAADPQYIEQAITNLAERAKIVSKIDIASILHESPKLLAKRDKAAAERKAVLSAKQAGLPNKKGKAAKKPIPRKPNPGFKPDFDTPDFSTD